MFSFKHWSHSEKHAQMLLNPDVCNLQVVGVTALACGMIAVGSCNGDVTSTIVQTIMEKNEQELKDSYARWLPLGLGLNHLGKHGHLQASELIITP